MEHIQALPETEVLRNSCTRKNRFKLFLAKTLKFQQFRDPEKILANGGWGRQTSAWLRSTCLTALSTTPSKLQRARSRLYRSRILRPNMHFSAFFEIYKIQTPLHRSKFKILANFRQVFSYFFWQFCRILHFSVSFVIFRTEFDGIFSDFHEF